MAQALGWICRHIRWLAGFVTELPDDVGVRARGKREHRADRRDRSRGLRRRVYPGARLWRNLGRGWPAGHLFPAHRLRENARGLRLPLEALAEDSEEAGRASARER